MITQDDIDAMCGDELLPCPFCGGDAAEPWFNDEDGNERGEVYCSNCTCSIQSGYIGWMNDKVERYNSIIIAITAWNTRANLQRNTDKL